MKKFKGDMAINNLVSIFSELGASVFTGILYYMLGPKIAFTSMFLLVILGTILLIIFWDNIGLIPLFITISKFGITAAFNMVYMAATMLVPTMFSSTVFGFSNFTARIITMIAPIMAEMPYPVPLIFTLGASVLGLVAC